MLSVRILGEFSVTETETGEPVLFPDETARKLAKILIMRQGQPVTAEALIEACWPHARRPARSALHAAISRLRHALEPGLRRGVDSRYVRRRGGGYAFAVDQIRLDRAQYEEWAALAERQASFGDWSGAAKAVDAAESCLAGDLLACEPYADWAAPARQSFRQRRADVLELGLTAHRLCADWPALIRLAQLALTVDNTRESVYRHLMDAYTQIGEQGHALAIYDACRRTLAAELGTDPSPATQALYAEILSAHAGASDAVATVPAEPAAEPTAVPADDTAFGPADARASRPPEAARGMQSGLDMLHRIALGSVALPLVGRSSMLGDLAKALSAGHLVVLSGEPGVGKTRLATETLNQLAADGAVVFAGSCRAASHSLPYEPLAEALGPLWPASAVGRGLVHFRGVSDDPQRLFAAALSKLLAVAEERFVVFCLDDVHLAETDVIAFVHHLMPRLGPRPGGGRLAVLVTARDAELARHDRVLDAAATARRQGLLTEVEVPRLTAADIEDLVFARADEDEYKCRTMAAHLFAESEGNALFTAERIRDWLDGGVIRIRGGMWQWRDRAFWFKPLPAAADLARQRTAGLSTAARKLLHAAVIVGEAAPFAWLAAIVGGDPAEALSALDELLERRIVLELRHRGKTTYSIGHRLVGDALLRLLPAARRTHLHLQAARALAPLAERDRSVPPALVADQFRLGADDRLALQWHRRAATAARAAAAVADATAQLQTALDLARKLGDAASVADCCLQLGEVTASTEGYTDAVINLYTEAHESAPTDSVRARVCLSWATAALAADAGRALALATRGLTLARSLRDREHIIWALALQAAAHTQSGDRHRAMRAADAAVAAYNEPPDESRQKLWADGRQPLETADPTGFALRYQAIWEATRLLRQIGHTAGEVAGSLYLTDVAAVSVYLPDLEVWAESVLAVATGDEEEHALALLCLSWVAFTKGQFDKGSERLRRIIGTAERHGWHGLLFASRLMLAATLSDAGQQAEAHRVLTPALEAADAIGELRARVLARYIRAFIYWNSGDHASACDWAEAALAIGHGHLQTMDLIHLRRILGAARLGLGEWQQALALAEANIETARAAGRLLDEGFALGLKGHALALLGDTKSGREWLSEAAAILARIGEFIQREQMLAILASLDEENGA